MDGQMVGTAGRRQRLGPEERREQLMTAAVDVLAELGYTGATAEVIAQRAGVSKGLLWHYFTDLQELFEVTARRTLKTMSTAVGSSIDLTAPAPEVIRSAIHAAAALRHTHGPERRAMREIIFNLRTADGQPRLGQLDLEDLYSSQEAIFRRGQRDGDFRATLDPRVLAITYQGAVDSMLGYLDEHPDAIAEHHAHTVAEILLGGITQPRRARRAGPVRTQ